MIIYKRAPKSKIILPDYAVRDDSNWIYFAINVVLGILVLASVL